MLGDTATAVLPDDERFKDMVGEELINPFFPDRKMIIITNDIFVDKDLGAGAVKIKITPVHEPNYFSYGQRNNLEMINIFNDDGPLNENGGEFQRKLRYD